MKNRLFVLLIALTGCSANHEHDGLYIANKTVTGVIKVWILNGSDMTIYSMGTEEVVSCKQFTDRIEIEGNGAYHFANDSTITIIEGSERNEGYKMQRVSKKTKFNFGELNKIVEKRSQEQIRFRRNSLPE